MEIPQPKQLARNILLDMRSTQKCASHHKIRKSTKQKIFSDSVSSNSIILIFYPIVDKPQLQPRKDYDDYTKFINDTYAEEKEHMLSQTVTNLEKTGAFEKY